MLKITVILALLGYSLAIPNFGFRLGLLVPCTNGLDLSDNIQQCADQQGMTLPEIPGSIEEQFAHLCRLAPPRDGQDPQTVALNTCVRNVCPVSILLNIMLRSIPCDTILSQILPGCTFETLQERITTCVPQAGVPQLLGDAGLSVVLYAVMEPSKIIQRLPCAIYAALGSVDIAYENVRACIAKKCPNFPDPDLNAVCPDLPNQNPPNQNPPDNPSQDGQGGRGNPQNNPPSNDPPPPPRDPPSRDPPPRESPRKNPGQDP